MGDTEARAIDRADPGEAPKYNGPSKAALQNWRIQTPPFAWDEDDTEEKENLPKP
jgi:hypothetical protein